MKKFVALLLCVAMLMVGVVAQAETAYEYVKAQVNSDEDVEEGNSFLVEDETSHNKTVLIFDFHLDTIGLFGDNAAGKCEGTIWELDAAIFLRQFILLSIDYDQIAEMTDDGYSLLMQMTFDGDTTYTINSSTEALAIVEKIINAIYGE